MRVERDVFHEIVGVELLSAVQMDLVPAEEVIRLEAPAIVGASTLIRMTQ